MYINVAVTINRYLLGGVPNTYCSNEKAWT